MLTRNATVTATSNKSRGPYKCSGGEREHFVFLNPKALDTYPEVIGGLLNKHRRLLRVEYLTFIGCFSAFPGGWDHEETVLLRPGDETVWLWSHSEDMNIFWE